MDTSPKPSDPDFGSTIPADGKPFLAGRYQVIRKLGEGGMWEVYLAEDQALDNKQFAIKMPPSVLARNPRAVETLKKEALRAMALSHPHVVTVRSFEQTDDGVLIIMDYVEGESLEELLRRKCTLNKKELRRIFTPIAEALDYAHSKGLVHRDVKPSNVMIGSDGTSYIMEFGIAREAKEPVTRFTGKETTSGTLPYMSPEQVRGKRPTPAQDIYSLAATMYESIAGHPPFHRGDLHYQVINETPDPPDVPDGNMSPQIGLIMRGLSKDADDRPASCVALVRPDEPKIVATPKPVAPPDPKPQPQTPPQPVAPPRPERVHAAPVAVFNQPEPPRRSSSGLRIGLLVVLVVTIVGIAIGMYYSEQQRFAGRELRSPDHFTDAGRSVPQSRPQARTPGTSTPSNNPSSSAQGAQSSKASTSNPRKAGSPKLITLPGNVKMAFRWCPPGEFMMGSPSYESGRDDDEDPHHRVTFTRGFWMGETEVTITCVFGEFFQPPKACCISVVNRLFKHNAL